MNTTENNKIIAEFMGATFERENIARIRLSVIRGEISFEDLKFNSDWNWLMEVVENIESLGYWTRLQSMNKGLLFKFCIGKIGFKSDFERRCPNKIEVVYNTCIEFIKWYNEQKQ